MNKLVIDIETVGKNMDDFDKISKDYFSHWAENAASNEKEIEAELKKVEDSLGLSPLTAEIACIGILNPDTDKGKVYYQDLKEKDKKFEDKGIEFEAMTEKDMLTKFWDDVDHYEEFITFNGRGFDIPFLMIRSAIHKIKPTKNLLSNRYLNSQFRGAKHIDLLDQLQFYGATWGKRGYSLHMFCQAFGIESPKDEGVSGGHVKEMFAEGRYEDIARYNVDDLYATAKLYNYWNEYINI